MTRGVRDNRDSTAGLGPSPVRGFWGFSLRFDGFSPVQPQREQSGAGAVPQGPVEFHDEFSRSLGPRADLAGIPRESGCPHSPPSTHRAGISLAREC